MNEFLSFRRYQVMFFPRKAENARRKKVGRDNKLRQKADPASRRKTGILMT